MFRWILLFVVLIGAQYVCGNAEELFCKDPDTHEYHPVNSTWRSTSFCGNYTCKVRPKNNTATEYIPLNNDDKISKEVRPKNNTTTEYIPLNNDKISKEAKVRKIIEDLRDAFHKTSLEDVQNQNSETSNNVCSNCNEVIDTEDRYLKTEEVNSIAKFLYSVKKSELDTLVEMYKIASDLYGEMDTSATEDTPQAILSVQAPPSQTSESFYPIQAVSKPISYWYNPSVYKPNQYTQFNAKPASYPYSYAVGYSRPEYGSKFSVHAHTSEVQTPTLHKILPTQLPRQAPLENPFDKMRASASEVHPCPYSFYPSYTSANSNPMQVKNNPNPIDGNADSQDIPNVSNSPSETKHLKPQIPTNPATGIPTYSQVIIANPMAYQMAYPQAYYNFTANPYTQYIPLQYLNMNYYNPNLYNNIANMKSNVEPNQIRTQADKSNMVSNGAPSAIANDEWFKQQYPWKTPPLSSNTLESVRAHVLQRTPSLLSRSRMVQPGLLNPLKRLKLERIGKVVRLDELKRPRRDAENIEEQHIDVDKKHIESDEERTEIVEHTIKIDDNHNGTDESHIGKDEEYPEKGDSRIENDIKHTKQDEEHIKEDEKHIEEDKKHVEEEKKHIQEEIKHIEKEIEFIKEKKDNKVEKKQENESMETYIIKTRYNRTDIQLLIEDDAFYNDEAASLKLNQDTSRQETAAYLSPSAAHNA